MGGFRWRHAETNERTLVVTKLVRAASGLRAAMLLIDQGHTVEAVALLRTVADFATETQLISEGILEGRFTEDQTRFIAQHHDEQPSTPEELAASEKEHYVGRKAIAKAFKRLAEKSGGGGDDLLRLAAFLNRGYDNYVHGKYESAMELFSGGTGKFLMAGTASEHNICLARVTLAGKVGEALNALRLAAMVWPRNDVYDEAQGAFHRLIESGEDSSDACA